MNEYEALVIYHNNQTEDQIGQFGQKVEGLIKKNGGQFFFAKNMGKKNFAYPIEKETKGTYYCYDFAAAGQTVSELERLMRLDESVVRFITVRKGEDVDVEKRLAEVAARGEGESKAETKPEAKEES